MEVGSTADANLGTRRADAAQRALTEHILTLADQAGHAAALIDATAEGSVTTWPQFAHMVRTAARGLSRRGLREADTAGILVQDAVSHVLAVHAVRAAGAIAAPVGPLPASVLPAGALPDAQAAADVAAQLKRDGARMLITSAAAAELAIAAAERSWVRQVFAFGEAEGTTPFGSLLAAARNESTSHVVRDVETAAVLDAAGLELDGPIPGLDGSIPGLTWRDVVVAAPPCGDLDAYTWLLDLALAAGATIVAAPLPQVMAAVGVYQGTAAIGPGGMEVCGLPAERIFTVG